MAVPQHIAFILDGNRRWAKENGVPSMQGHVEGAKNLKKIAEHLKEKGVKYFTVYALSVENLKTRTAEELAFHFGLHKKYLKNEILDSDKFMKDGTRFRMLGQIDKLPKDEQEMIKEAEEKTKNNDKLFFNVCLVYDGQDEIVDAVKQLVKEGVNPDDITRESIKSHLYTKDIPPPEMIIRTGMDPEMRLSGFLLWDSTYSEFFFTKTYWPAFTTEELDKIIEEFESRERRFGK